MMRWVLLSIVVALWAVQLLIGRLAWAESPDTADRSSSGPPLSVIAGPAFITTIYPIVKLDKTLVEVMPITENAYNFWGKEHISERRIKTYFPTPLAYPYQFSKMGLESLRNHLKDITLVDPTSVELKSWPTIPQKWQYEYRPDDLQTLLTEEPYVQFRVRGWDRVTFMKFPTFVAVMFDYTRQLLKSYADYKALATYWRGKIDSLRQLEDFGEVLGISRKTREWASIPILTFASSPAFMWSDAFGQRYIFSPEPWEETSRLFLREISLRGISTNISNGEIDGSLVGCNDILHEKDRITVWRFYYSSEPLFYTGQNWPLMVVGPTGPEVMFNRLLRIALFVNVTLPDMPRASASAG